VNVRIKAFEDVWDDQDLDGAIRGVVTTEYFLSYQKVNGKWSLMLDSECDYGTHPNNPDRQSWVFRDAPRYLRVKAIPAIPTLIEGMIKEANRLTVELIANTADARKLAESIKPKKEQ